MIANNVYEVCNRTIRPMYKSFDHGSCFTQSPSEQQFMGVFGKNGIELFLVALDEYDKEELSKKLVTNLKSGDVIYRLYSDYIGYCGFAIFNFQKGKVRYFDNVHYEETDEYRFEKYWSKPHFIRVKLDEVERTTFN